MKLKLIVLLAVIFIFGHPINAQTADDKPQFLSIGWTPLNTLEPLTSTMEGVLEIQLPNRFTIETKFGFPFKKFSRFSHRERINDRYYELKFGAKYLLKARQKYGMNFTPFVGLEYAHVNHHYEKSADWLVRDDIQFIFESAKIHRTVHGIRLKYGHLYFIKKNWIIEYYNGLGIRRVHVDYHTINERESNQLRYDETPIPINRTAGGKLKIDAVFGVKVSYKMVKW